MKQFLRSTFAWLGLFVLAFVNGALREVGFKQIGGMGEPLAHQLSCLTGVLLWTVFTWVIWSKLEIYRMKQALLVGTGWFIATWVFETFILSRNLSWTEIIHTYDVLAGEYWGLVLLWIWIMPAAILKVKALKK